MHEPWFYCPILRCGEVALDEAEQRHALQSRRLRPGDALTVFDGNGHVGQARLLPEAEATETGQRRGRHRSPAAVLVDNIVDVRRPERTLTLFVPACKGPRLDWLVEKCTELGVTRLVLTAFERSIVQIGAAHVEKLQRTAIEACKQCRRAWLPRIEAGVTLADVARPGANAALLIAHLDQAASPLGQWLHEHLSDVRNLTVVVGPEGGLAPAEVNALSSMGGQMVRLAEHVLRVETAAIAVAASWAAMMEGRS